LARLSLFFSWVDGFAGGVLKTMSRRHRITPSSQQSRSVCAKTFCDPLVPSPHGNAHSAWL
jgi:hypothetical protein